MLVFYTTERSKFNRKILSFFKEYNIDYEMKMIKTDLTKEDILLMLKNSYDGFDSILKEKTNEKVHKLNLTTTQIIEHILTKPTSLIFPIIVDKDSPLPKMMNGYDVESIRIFIPKEYRKREMKNILDKRKFFY